jgi:hypothetical protein
MRCEHEVLREAVVDVEVVQRYPVGLGGDLLKRLAIVCLADGGIVRGIGDLKPIDYLFVLNEVVRSAPKKFETIKTASPTP